ncbi:MAG: hypothetical protein GSR84_06465 [Desulfurococcales archaeon]|nr:hypothetical protein [Desulfurococcales archaeon]
MRSSVAVLGVFVAVLLVGAAAYALSGYAHGQEPASQETGQAPPGSPSSGGWGPMMGGMGGMMDGHDEAGPSAGPGAPVEGAGWGPGMGMYGFGSFDDMIGMMEDMEEEMEEHFNSVMDRIVEVNGTLVDVVDRGNRIVVETSDGQVVVKVMKMYMDTSNGYLFSGVWLVEQLEDAIENGETVNVSIVGVGGPRGMVALGISVDGMGSYMNPVLYDLSR